LEYAQIDYFKKISFWEQDVENKVQLELYELYHNIKFYLYVLVQLQAIFLWYGSKGVELHDKDFGFLTFVSHVI
jgi:hypothetical protein